MSTVNVWHIVLKEGEPKVVEVPEALSIRVSNIALGDEIADPNGRTVIKLSYESLFHDGEEDEEDEDDEDDEVDDKLIPIVTTVLGALTPGKIEQASLDITLENETVYHFETTGKNTVYITGNYFVAESAPEGFSDFEDDSDEEGHLLHEVSSDVEVPADELDDIMDTDNERFEEVDENDKPVKSTKRPRDSDATEEHEVSKTEKKKLKLENGKAVAVEQETKVEKKDKKKKKKEKAAEATKEDGGVEKKEHKDTGAANKKTLSGGLVVEDSKAGAGPQAKKGSTVSMRYIGKLTNGKVFDKNIKGKPFTFNLGRGQVIKGWDEGLVGIQAGGERKLTIPAAMGYGKKGSGSDIPPNSTLVFEVKCIEVK